MHNLCIIIKLPLVWRNLCLVSLTRCQPQTCFSFIQKFKTLNRLYSQNRKLGKYICASKRKLIHHWSLTIFKTDIFFKLQLDSLSQWFAHTNLLIFLSLRPASHPYHDMDRVLSKIAEDFSWIKGLFSHMIFRISATPNKHLYHFLKPSFWFLHYDSLLLLRNPIIFSPSFQPCLLLSITAVQAFLAFPLNGTV